MTDEGTILVVDDSTETLSLLNRVLSSAGYTVRPADSGELALAALAAGIPDLILLDLRMPGLSGLEICQRLKADPATRAIPVILLSAFAEADEWAEGLRLGAADYVLKPFRPEELLHRVRTQLALARARRQHEQLKGLQATNAGLTEDLRTAERDRATLRDHLGKADQMRKVLLSVLEDQRQAEAALQHSEALFRSTFDEAPVGAAIVGLDQAFQRVNTALCRFLGYPAEELLRRTFPQITHPDDIVDSVANVRRLLGGEVASFEIEKRYLRADGEVVRGRVSVSLVRDAAGRPLHFLPIIQDITERERAEAALRESEHRYATTLAAVNDGLWEWQVPSGAAYFSPGYYRMLGYADGAFIANYPNWRALVHPEDIDRVETDLRQSVGTSHGFAIDLRMKTGTGDWLWVSTRGNTIERDAAGQVLRMAGTLSDITQRKQAERDLEQFFSLVPDMVCIASADGRFLKLNDAWTHALGYTKEELMAVPYTAFIHPEDLAATRQVAVGQRAGQPATSFVNRYRAKDGSYHWLEWNATPLKKGEILFAAARDITEHRQAEEAMRESELRYRTLANSGPGLVWTSGLDKKCDYFNQTWLTFTGRRLEQELGNGWTEGVHPDDFARCVATYTTAFERRERFSMDYRLRHHSGEYRWIQDDGSPRFDSQGEFLGYIGHCLDITERKQAATALRESEARYRESIEFAVDGILRGSPTGHIIDANSQMLKLAGRPRAQLLGQRIDVLFSPAQLTAKPLRFDLLNEGQILINERNLLRPDGTIRPIEMHSKRMPDGTYQTIVRDITERRVAESSLRESEEKFSKVFHDAPVWIAITDLETAQYLDVNEAVLNAAGFAREEVLGHTAAGIGWITAEDRTRLKQAILAQGRIASLEMNFRTKDGRFLQGLVSGESIVLGGRSCLLTVTIDITERKRAEEALHESEQHHRLLIQHLHAGVVVHAPDTRILLANEQASVLLGLTIDQMLGKSAIDPAWCFLHEDGSPMPLNEYPVNRVRSALEPVRNLALGIHHPGTSRPVWVLINGFPDLDAKGQLRQIVVTFVDITQRKRAEESLRQSLHEKEALLKEVHHRVKNNLQIISSLLRLQAGQIDHPATSAVLHDMQGRIRSMALLHETLYRSGNLAQVDLADYLQTVCTQSLRAAARRPGTAAIRLEFDLAPVLLDATRAVPCGLLVNELVSNCLKHAFPDEREGTVQVSLQPVPPAPLPVGGTGLQTRDIPPAALRLCVSDDGAGLPPGFDLTKLNSLGLQLVSDLTRQLQGTLEISTGPGTRISVLFRPQPSGSQSHDEALPTGPQPPASLPPSGRKKSDS